MAILTIKELTVSFGPTPLFQNADLSIETGECVALVGRNGTGKSTLLKIIAGEPIQDCGSVQVEKNTKVAIVSQMVPLELKGTVYEVVATGLPHVGELLQAYQEILKKLQDDFSESLLQKQADIAHKIDVCDGWLLDQQIQTILSKLQLNATQKVETLSGGLKRRVLLARALVSNPDILLLDEPTNHLDMESVVWLESFLKKWGKTIIVITHDRQFMSNLATRIIENDYQKLLSWPGNYDRYCQLKIEMIASAEKEQALFDKKLAQEEVWIRQGVKARRTRNEGRVRRLEALREEKTKQFKQQGSSKIHIQMDRKSGKVVFDIESLCFQFNDHHIVSHFSSVIARGDRVGIVGPNGCGKSTLVKLLLGDLQPNAGKITCGTNLEIAYFDQYRLELDEKQTVIDNVALGREKITIDGKDKHVISYLQDFLFTPDRARIKVSQLSGGERNRLLLAKLFSRPANLIVMDEPTNDLDIETLELLEEKLSDFPGTLLVISHDRKFLENVVTQLWVMENNGHIQEHVGGHFDWENIIPDRTVFTSEKKAPKVPANHTQPAVKIKSAMNSAEKRELSALLKKIATLENEINGLQHALSEPHFYQQDPELIKLHSKKIADAEKQLENCYQRWQELEGN